MWLHISNVDVIGWEPLAYIVTCGGDSIPTEGTLLGIRAREVIFGTSFCEVSVLAARDDLLKCLFQTKTLGDIWLRV